MLTLSLMGLLGLWAIFMYMEGKSRARLNYLRFQPLISSYTNGTKWIRKHNQSLLSLLKSLILYTLIITYKVHLASASLEGYSNWGISILHLSFCVIPITIGPFYFDWGYYKEFSRLANLPNPGEFLLDHQKTLILQIGKKQTRSLLFTSTLFFILQILILHSNYKF